VVHAEPLGEVFHGDGDVVHSSSANFFSFRENTP